MSNPRSFAQGMSKGLDLAIPLVIQKRRLDVAQEQFDQQMTMKRLEMMDEAEQAHDKIQADILSKTLMKAIETGDESLAQSVMPELQSRFGVGFDLPEDLSGKTPTTLQGLAVQGLNPQEAIEILKSKAKGKPGQPRFYQHRDDPNDIITIQDNAMPPEGYLPYSKPGKTKDMTTELRQRAKDVAKSEKELLDGDFAQVDFFNQYARKPYVYTITGGKVKGPFGSDITSFGLDYLWPDEKPGVKQIKLPKYNGKQVYAEDVYQTMIDNDMTFEEVLRAIGGIK